MTARTIHELWEELRELGVTSEQSHAFTARLAAEELRRLEDGPPRPEAPADWTAAFKLDLDGTVRRRIEFTRDRGIDDNVAARFLLPRVLLAGIAEADATAAIERVTGWRPRTLEKCAEDAMAYTVEDIVSVGLDAGYTPEEIKAVLHGIYGARAAA